MAARQGFSAQISQASEDAKQKILSHAPLKSSWFSNLNTTCTIKSAPPRTPEVLSLLSIKSGWLWKRNEQHVWQARWCCVVPHTFLYYFDTGGSKPPPPLTHKMQTALNNAVKSGYGDRPHSGPRQSFNVFQNVPSNTEKDGETPTDKSPPAGIIDLECYSSVHRSSENELLLELAGDDSVNPDLRSFYFYCEDDAEGVDWTLAFLNNRFGALQDELEAFREVSTGFAAQLQELHSDLDFYKQQLEETQDECYSVRSSAEEARRTCFRIVRECLEEGSEETRDARQAYRRDLESARDLGTVVPALQLLTEYTKVLEETCVESSKKQRILLERLENISSDDATKVKELQESLTLKQQEWEIEKVALQQQVATLQQALLNSQKLTDDAQQEVTSTKMEMTMYQNSTKQRLGELLTHKKILKREVIDLRQKLDEVGSELSLLKHTAKTSMETVSQERKKSELLERYVERMESQVKVQQNMMELMSTSASVMHHGGGGSVASFTPRGYASEAPGIMRPIESTTTSPRDKFSFPDNESEIQREHNQLLARAREMVLEDEKNTIQVEDEEEEKSHMSELTEDRTQKHFYAQFGGDSPMVSARRKATPKRLPSYIGVQGEDSSNGATPLTRSPPREHGYYREENGDTPTQKLDTIMSAAVSLPPQRSSAQRNKSSPLSDNKSVNSTSKVSVAQRARQLADERNSTSVRVRAPPPRRGSHSDSSLLGNLGKSLSEVIDQSVLGVPSSSDSDDLSTDDDERERRYGDYAHSDTGASEVVRRCKLVIDGIACLVFGVLLIPRPCALLTLVGNVFTGATSLTACQAVGLSQGAGLDQE